MTVRHVLAKTDELEDGQMKGIEIDDNKVLLLRQGDAYFAFVGECPHHGAPLADGVLCEGKIRCPWHQTVFDAKTGRVEQPPSLDSLAQYRVEVVGGNVVGYLPREEPRPVETPTAPRSGHIDARKAARQGEYASQPLTDQTFGTGRNFVIIGSGAAGFLAAETLRAEGFAGNVTILTAEEHLPYDRTELSKRFLADPDSSPPFLKDGSYLDNRGIDILYDHKVSSVDSQAGRLVCQSGSSLEYDELLIASGSRPRRLDVEGADLDGVMTLRSYDDCRALRSRADGIDQAVVIGASFIGMEVAASLASRKISMQVIAPEDAPFQATLGPEVGRMLRSVHEKQGTEFHMGRKVKAFQGRDGKLEAIILDDDTRIETELAVVGIGVEPVTDFLPDELTDEDGAIRVDAHLRHSAGFFAAGDIARFDEPRAGGPVRIEHWRLAQQLGALAARNMAGQDATFQDVPFFWTKQFKTIVQYVGFGGPWDQTDIEGSVSGQDFLVYYLADGKVRGVSGAGRDRQMSLVAEVLARSDAPLDRRELVSQLDRCRHEYA